MTKEGRDGRVLTVPAGLLVALVLALGGLAVAATLAGPVQLGRQSILSRLLTTTPLPTPSPTYSFGTATPSASPLPQNKNEAPALVDLGWLGWTAALAVLVAVALRRSRRRERLARARRRDLRGEGPPPGGAPGSVPDGLRRAARAAAVQARQPGPPRDAVVACWVALEEAAADAGSRRDPAATPTEFTSAVLAEHDADPASVARLLHLYHRARFSVASSVGPADAEAAAAALDRIAETLGRPAARRVGS